MELRVARESCDNAEAVFAYSDWCRPLRHAHHLNADEAVLSAEADRFMLLGTVTIPAVGQEFWLADNDGAGFASSDGPVDFRREACRTWVRRIAELADSLVAQGMPRCQASAGLVAAAQAALAAGELDQAIAHTYWAGERLVASECDWRLAAPDAALSLGINTKGLHNCRSAWDEHFAGVFDYATIPATWGVLEPEKDRPRYDVLDELVDWCKSHDIAMKAHALIWHSGFENTWLAELSPEEMMRRSEQRMRTLLGQIGGDLDAAEIVNEPIQTGNRQGLSVAEQLEETLLAGRLCDELAGDMRKMISFTREDESWFAGRQRERPDLICLAEFIDRCIDGGCQPDLLGLQLHLPSSLFRTRLILRYWYDRFGLPLHATELTPRSDAEPTMVFHGRPYKPGKDGWHGRGWSETVQADHARAILRLYKALPFVETATFWATTDKPVLWHRYLYGTPQELYRLPWAAGQGLLREDLTPKPILATLGELADG